MFDYSQYAKAPIIETKDFKSPENGYIFFYNTQDKKKIRIGIWYPKNYAKTLSARAQFFFNKAIMNLLRNILK